MARDLDTYPLHFETQPSGGAPAHAELLGMGMLVAWAASRVGLAKKYAKSEAAKQLAARKITGREFLVQVLKSKLSDADVDKSLGDFLNGYIWGLFLEDSDRDRKATAKTLGMKGEDEIGYSDDYNAAFKKVVKNPFLVPDTWQAFDRLAPILDARWADYQATKFLKAPPKGLYEKAVKARDAVKVAAPKQTAQKFEIDPAFTDQLLSLVGRSLKDPDVRNILTVAGLKVGKVIDEQALPALGVSYMGWKFQIGGKRELGVSNVTFYKKGVTSYIRGIGAKVTFAQYAGALPRGLAFSDDRAAVQKKLGKSTRDDDYLEFPDHKQRCYYQVHFKGQKMQYVSWSISRKRDEG